MSISDRIVVMKAGVVQQIGRPQEVYDNPVNLFVAKFLGTPPINVFVGRISQNRLYIGEDAVLDAAGAADKKVYVGVRPEGFVLCKDGPLRCELSAVEVMGRDSSVVCMHPSSLGPNVRAIVDAQDSVSPAGVSVRFSLKPGKVFVFDWESEERIALSLTARTQGGRR